MAAVSTPITILRRRQVEARTGLARSTIYDRLRDDPTFPRPVPLGAKAVGWVEAEVDAWLAAQVRAARGGRPT